MIITKTHQEMIVSQYSKNRNEFEVMGFVEGMNKALDMLSKGVGDDKFFLAQLISYSDGILWEKLYRSNDKLYCSHIETIAESDMNTEYKQGRGISSNEFLSVKDITPIKI